VPTILFYIDAEVQKRLLAGSLLKNGELELMDGYRFTFLSGEYAETMAACQLHADEETIQLLRHKLDNFPGVDVVSKGSDGLVAFETCDGLGYIAYLYCLPEHRGKGIASALEKHLCERICREWVLLLSPI